MQGLALHFQLPSRVRSRLRQGWAPAGGVLLAAASLLSATSAQAQSFTWVGTGSTTNTGEYTLGTNWANPPVSAPPIAAGQSAIFDTTGSTTVTVTSGPIAPDSWTFTANSQSYSISGAAVNFSLAGAGGGIIDNASSGRTISISNNIGGVGVQVQLLGNSTLVLSGTNTYSGGTFICSCASLQLGDATHTASIVGAVTNFGTFNIVNANTSGITSITNDLEGGAILPGLTTFFNGTSAGTMAITNKNGGETDFGFPFSKDIASAGNAVIVNRVGGLTEFNGMSTAGNANITNRFGGETDFYDHSNAGSATIVNRFAGVTTFNDFSSAMNASITSRFGGETDFYDHSSAGSATITNRFGGSTIFFDHSTAGNATIVNGSFGGPFSTEPVGLGFFDHSSAGTATIVNNNNGFIAFGIPFGNDTASADHATIINNAGSALEFNAFTTAGNATITTNSGGAVAFFDASTGGNAQFITNGAGYVDFSRSIGPGFDGRITAGSIAGSGTYYIGAGHTLIVGSNNLSTEVSGVIADFFAAVRPDPARLKKSAPTR